MYIPINYPSVLFVVLGAATFMNVASNRKAVQSSTSLGKASDAVDGVVDTCSETGREKYASWTVDLVTKRIVTAVKVNAGNPSSRCRITKWHWILY